MIDSNATPRRSFLGRMAATAVAAGLPWSGGHTAAAATQDWTSEVGGSHKCFFDFPNHKLGFPLVHIFNYINTYASAYGVGNEEVGTVGTFYGGGPASRVSTRAWTTRMASHTRETCSITRPRTIRFYSQRGCSLQTSLRLRVLCP